MTRERAIEIAHEFKKYFLQMESDYILFKNSLAYNASSGKELWMGVYVYEIKLDRRYFINKSYDLDRCYGELREFINLTFPNETSVININII